MVKNHQPEWSVRRTQCSLAFLICAIFVRIRIAINLYCAHGLHQGFSLKKSRFLGVIFIKGEVVKKELKKKPKHLYFDTNTNSEPSKQDYISPGAPAPN